MVNYNYKQYDLDNQDKYQTGDGWPVRYNEFHPDDYRHENNMPNNDNRIMGTYVTNNGKRISKLLKKDIDAFGPAEEESLTIIITKITRISGMKETSTSSEYNDRDL